MKVGVLSPTTWQLVEKTAALFPEGVEVVGPLADDGHYWNNYSRKVDEWVELGLRVSLNLAPYSSVDFSAYDLLIESVETFIYSKDWRGHCHRPDCPILVKACWTRSPVRRSSYCLVRTSGVATIRVDSDWRSGTRSPASSQAVLTTTTVMCRI